MRKILPLALMAACLFLGACVKQHEAAEQKDAAEYHDQQRDSTLCASQGLLPGSDAFKACLAQLNPPAASHP